MPLRDDFRPPLDDRHSWDEVHGMWPATIVLQLRRILPKGFEAAPNVKLGASGFEVDVASFEPDELAEGSSSVVAGRPSGTMVKKHPEPTFTLETDLPFQDEYEVRVYDARRGRRLVAAIEIVSPANKDRVSHRQAFVGKCLTLLRQQVSVSIVDIVTVRHGNLFGELLEAAGGDAAERLGEKPPQIYSVTCRFRADDGLGLLESWHSPLVVGKSLPPLTLWLTPDWPLEVDLERSYEEACDAVNIQ